MSDSWGSCETDTPHADIQRDEQALEAAAARGISVFVAAGDTGAYTCQVDTDTNHRLTVSWPSSSPFAVSVGGTSLSVTSTGAYAGETAWNDTLEQSGGGGGLSADFNRPAVAGRPRGRQPVLDRHAPASGRGRRGRSVVRLGRLHRRRRQRGRGTSAATPFWAASMALVAEYAGHHGARPTRVRGPRALRHRCPSAAGARLSRHHDRRQPLLPGLAGMGLRELGSDRRKSPTSPATCLRISNDRVRVSPVRHRVRRTGDTARDGSCGAPRLHLAVS